ncbi:MAG: DUF4926 domain-containing protein [Cyanobacteriota bacterium]|nr:DUF4926 domain-containing protein [Cyanobacteriota bacterium]
MIERAIKLLDVIALTVDLPEYHLWRGQVGTVVEILAGGEAFEVECARSRPPIRRHSNRKYSRKFNFDKHRADVSLA